LRQIEYRELINMLRQRGWEVKENQNEILATYYPPPIEEAGGENYGEVSQRYYLLKFIKNGNLAYLDSAFLIEEDKVIKAMSKDEIELWLESLIGG